MHDNLDGCPICGATCLPDGTCPVIGEPWHTLHASLWPDDDLTLPLQSDLEGLEGDGD